MEKLRAGITSVLPRLSRSFLRKTAGGNRVVCISGCYTQYLGAAEEGSPCAFTGNSGGVCYGTVANSKCCT